MKIGIVADIHEAIEPLRRALELFREHGVDHVVNLGDACDIYSASGKAADVAELLRDAGAVGVWGNHDIGLCHEVSEKIAANVDAQTLAYMTKMRPFVSMHDCRFSHVEPWLDAMNYENLWYFEEMPNTPEMAARSFEAVPEHMLFVGHFHRWLIMTPSGNIDWSADAPLDLDPKTRHLILVAPVVSGWCVIYDQAESRLIPLRCD